MPIFLGNQSVDLFLGATKISKAYLGDTLVYQSALPYASGLGVLYDGILNAGNSHDGSSAIWKDLSGNDVDGTVTFAGSDRWAANGVRFNTSGSNVRLTKDLYTRPFTVEFAVTLSANHNYGTLMRGVSNSGIRDAWIGTNGRVMVRVQNQYDGPTKTISTGTMHTISITFTGNTQRVYIDGVYYSTPSKSWSNGASSSFYLFGDPTAGASRVIQGVGHSFRWYDRVLSDDEILANYNIDAARFA